MMTADYAKVLEWPPRQLHGIALAWAHQRNAFGFSR
jgi:hypothetical protein